MDNLQNKILEDILLQLPMEELLSSTPEVCQRWRHVIQTSPRTQSYLFKTVNPARDADREQPWSRSPLTEQWFRWDNDTPRGPFELENRSAVRRVPSSWEEMHMTNPSASKVRLESRGISIHLIYADGVTVADLADLVAGGLGRELGQLACALRGDSDVAGPVEAPSRVILQ